ncbi:helix-turn-helix domain-containing protein [Actinomycetospora atypica]|uniref:Helix-turn-helix domain-containing protein n=1 Tax=Actinomycetospora atypica TaxID=1290095 RepID=A0ABV9YI53_9PSEU
MDFLDGASENSWVRLVPKYLATVIGGASGEPPNEYIAQAGLHDPNVGQSDRIGFVRILYIAQLLKYDGFELAGRSLVRQLSADHKLRLCGAVVEDDSPLLAGHLSEYVVPVRDMTSFDVVYMEGGWNHSDGHPIRVPFDSVKNFVFQGGQLIVADAGRYYLEDHGSAVDEAQEFLGAYFPSREEGVRYLYDIGAEDSKGSQRFRPELMRIGDRFETIWTGIDSILTLGSIAIAPREEILGSGHSSTAVMISDQFVDRNFPSPWASIKTYGGGHVVLIAASVSADFLVDRNPDNARWISNILDAVLDRSRETAKWLKPGPGSGSALDPVNVLQEDESQQHERKSSFLTPVDSQRADVNRKVLQESVGKSIAALANTDGGQLVIGQADDGEVLGLAEDFRCLGKLQSRDGFTQRLADYVGKFMSPNWEYIGINLDWVEQDGKDVAVVNIPRCALPVYLDTQSASEVIFVRRGTRTERLQGRALGEWLSGPRFLAK